MENINLTPLQRSILEKRYVELLNQFKRRCWFVAIFFHTSRIIVTVGSLVVPALLSIQYTEAAPAAQSSYSMTYQIYWVTWVISLLVTTFNGMQSIFKIEKKYYFLHTTMEQLRSEGWQYFELSGRYSGFYTPSEHPSHENQFIYFCASIEKIKMHQVEEEYWKINESSQDSNKGTTDKKNQLIPPTPFKALQTIVDVKSFDKNIEFSDEKTSKEQIRNAQRELKETKEQMPMPIILSETTDGSR